MAENLVTYCVVHQPRRIKLPAQVIPAGTKPADMAAYLFDDVMNRRYFDKVARWCYYPACQMFLDMLDQGYKLGLGFSVSFLWQLRRWDAELAERFRRLVAHPNCELVGVEPYHSFAFAIDIKLFQKEMKRGKDYAEEFFDKEIRVTDTTEMVMNNEIYYALLQSGYRAGMLDGRKWVLDWREPTHLYSYGERDLGLFCRHHELSDDVGYRFSNKTWAGYPLRADTYAAQPAQRLGRLRLHRLGLRDLRRAPQRRHGHLRLHAGAAGPAQEAGRPLPHARARRSTSSARPPARSAAARVRHHLGRLRGHGVLPGQRLAAGDLPAHALGAPQGPAHRQSHAARPGALAAPVRQPAPHPVGGPLGLRGRGVGVLHARRVVGSGPGQDPHRAAARLHQLRPGDG